MDVVKVGRLLLAFVLAGIAAYLVWSFVTMPYELVQAGPRWIEGSTQVKPDGLGTMALAIVFSLLALVAAFSGDWD